MSELKDNQDLQDNQSLKVGDKVITTKDCRAGLFEKGLITEVVALYKNRFEEVAAVDIKDKDGWIVYAESEEIEPYVEGEQGLKDQTSFETNFKVGDVVVTTKNNIDGWFTKECKGLITAINEQSNLYKVVFATGQFESGGDNAWWCKQDEIELVHFVEGISDFVTADVNVEPLTDFGYTPKARPSEIVEPPVQNYIRTSSTEEKFIDGVLSVTADCDYKLLKSSDGFDYLELYNKLSIKQYKKLEKVALKLDKIGEVIGADYHEMLELLKRHF